MRVEVFADVWCPYTHVGLRRLVEERARLGRPDVIMWVRGWPLELVNAESLGVDHVAEEIDALREVVAPELFTGFNPDSFPSTTVPALALAASAYRRGGRSGEQVSLALRTALFEEGRDIADPVELAAIAQAAGMECPDSGAERVLCDDWREGRRRGVMGSPHFFAGGRGFFCPSLTINRVEGRLRIIADPEGFAAFVDAAFAQPGADSGRTYVAAQRLNAE